VVLGAHLDRHVIAVHGDLDVLDQPADVFVLLVVAVPEPEDAVLAVVVGKIDGQCLDHVEVAVLRKVEVGDVRRDRGLLDGSIELDRLLLLGIAPDRGWDEQDPGDHSESDEGPHDPFHAPNTRAPAPPGTRNARSRTVKCLRAGG
jgi:hypothetical protein